RIDTRQLAGNAVERIAHVGPVLGADLGIGLAIGELGLDLGALAGEVAFGEGQLALLGGEGECRRGGQQTGDQGLSHRGDSFVLVDRREPSILTTGQRRVNRPKDRARKAGKERPGTSPGRKVAYCPDCRNPSVPPDEEDRWLTGRASLGAEVL